MAVFTDDFNRSDRPLASDNGWAALDDGTFAIVGGTLRATVDGTGTAATLNSTSSTGVVRPMADTGNLMDASLDAWADNAVDFPQGRFEVALGLGHNANEADGQNKIYIGFYVDTYGALEIYQRFIFTDGTTRLQSIAFADPGFGDPSIQMYLTPGVPVRWRFTFDRTTKVASLIGNGTLLLSATAQQPMTGMLDRVGLAAEPRQGAGANLAILDNWSDGVAPASPPQALAGASYGLASVAGATAVAARVVPTRVGVRAGRTAFQRPRHSA